MTNRRWNQFINFANNNRPITELDPPIQNDEERKILENMVNQLAELRKTNPDASFANVDFEWGTIGD